MKLKTGMILLGGGVITYSLYEYIQRQRRYLEQITFESQGIFVTNLQKDNVTISVKLKVNNPSDIEATVKAVDLNLYFEGNYIGRALLDTPVVIPAGINGVANFNIVPITIMIDPSLIKANGLSILGSIVGTRSISLSVTGNMTVSANFITKTIPITFNQAITIA